jgi:hypothetical protein
MVRERRPPACGDARRSASSAVWVKSSSSWSITTSIPGASTATSPSIYVIADKPTGTIAVIDPTTFETTGEIRALATAPSLNSLAATPGVLWAVSNSGGILQRFDTAG